MKRLLVSFFSLALIFTLSPLHSLAKAEEAPKEDTKVTNTEQPQTLPAPLEEKTTTENKDQQPATNTEKETPKSNTETQPPATNTDKPKETENNTTTPVTETKMEIHRKLNDAGYAINAKLSDVKSAEGTWTFYVDGKKKGTKKNKKTSVSFVLSLDADMEEAGEIKGHVIKIVFDGQADGKETKAEGTHSIPDLKFDYTQVGNNDKFTGTLNPAKEAVGNWGIAIANENGDKIIDAKDVENFKGTTFTHIFKGIKAGTYLVYIAFEGKVDGEETAIIKFLTLEVTEEGNGGDIKAPPTDYKPTKPVDKGTVDKVINNSKKGGPMPKTATSNPTGMVAGLVLIALGGTILGYRRLVK
jgi:LPXTG-motif cell wall-anchored protein